jgi:hypothetical protein
MIRGKRFHTGGPCISESKMQEGMTVSFETMYLEPRITWFQKLFVLYLFSVLILTIYRTARVAWGIRKLRKLEAQVSSEETAQFRAFRDLCLQDTKSFREFSHLTLLLSLLVLAMGVTEVLMGVATEKTLVTSATAELMVEVITPFSAGIVGCIVLYCCAMFFDARLTRRRSKQDKQR